MGGYRGSLMETLCLRNHPHPETSYLYLLLQAGRRDAGLAVPSAPSCGRQFELPWVLRTKQNFLHFRCSLAHTGPRPWAACFRRLCPWQEALPAPPGASPRPVGAEAVGGVRPGWSGLPNGGRWIMGAPHLQRGVTHCANVSPRSHTAPSQCSRETPGAPDPRPRLCNAGLWMGRPTQTAGRLVLEAAPGQSEVHPWPPLLGPRALLGEMGPFPLHSGLAQGGWCGRPRQAVTHLPPWRCAHPSPAWQAPSHQDPWTPPLLPVVL